MDLSAATEREREQHVKAVEDTLHRISSHTGVVGYLVLNPADGAILKSHGFNGDARIVYKYAERIHGLTQLAVSTVRTIDWKDDLTFLRMSVGATDFLIATDVDKLYTLVVVQELQQ